MNWEKGVTLKNSKFISLLLYLCYSFHFSPVRLCIWSYQTWLSMTECFPLFNTFRFLLYISHFLDLSSLVTSSECKWQHNVVFIDGCVMYSVWFEWLYKMIFGGFSCLCYDIEVTIAIFTCGRQWALNYWRTIGSWPDHTDVVDKRISTRLCARLPANYCTMRYAPELYLYSYCESRYNCGAYLIVQHRVSIGMHEATWLTCNVHASLARCMLCGAC